MCALGLGAAVLLACLGSPLRAASDDAFVKSIGKQLDEAGGSSILVDPVPEAKRIVFETRSVNPKNDFWQFSYYGGRPGESTTELDPKTSTATRRYDWGALKARYHRDGDALRMTLSIQNATERPIASFRIHLAKLALTDVLVDRKGNIRPELARNRPVAVALGAGEKDIYASYETFWPPVYFGPEETIEERKGPDIYPLVVSGNVLEPEVGELVVPSKGIPRVPAGETLELEFALRLVDRGTPRHAALASFYEDYRDHLGPMTDWPDNRPAGATYLLAEWGKEPTKAGVDGINPRRWHFSVKMATVDIFSPQGEDIIRRGMRGLGRSAVGYLDFVGGQGSVLWNMEGAYHSTGFVGDPRMLPIMNPEMDEAVGDYFEGIKDPGYRVGCCIRHPQPRYSGTDKRGRWTQGVGNVNPNYDYVQDNYAEKYLAKYPHYPWWTVYPVAERLSDKIEYAKKRWGATLFYYDTSIVLRFCWQQRSTEQVSALADLFVHLAREATDPRGSNVTDAQLLKTLEEKGYERNFYLVDEIRDIFRDRVEDGKQFNLAKGTFTLPQKKKKDLLADLKADTLDEIRSILEEEIEMAGRPKRIDFIEKKLTVEQKGQDDLVLDLNPDLVGEIRGIVRDLVKGKLKHVDLIAARLTAEETQKKDLVIDMNAADAAETLAAHGATLVGGNQVRPSSIPNEWIWRKIKEDHPDVAIFPEFYQRGNPMPGNLAYVVPYGQTGYGRVRPVTGVRKHRSQEQQSANGEILVHLVKNATDAEAGNITDEQLLDLLEEKGYDRNIRLVEEMRHSFRRRVENGRIDLEENTCILGHGKKKKTLRLTGARDMQTLQKSGWLKGNPRIDAYDYTRDLVPKYFGFNYIHDSGGDPGRAWLKRVNEICWGEILVTDGWGIGPKQRAVAEHYRHASDQMRRATNYARRYGIVEHKRDALPMPYVIENAKRLPVEGLAVNPQHETQLRPHTVTSGDRTEAGLFLAWYGYPYSGGVSLNPELPGVEVEGGPHRHAWDMETGFLLNTPEGHIRVPEAPATMFRAVHVRAKASPPKAAPHGVGLALSFDEGLAPDLGGGLIDDHGGAPSTTGAAGKALAVRAGADAAEYGVVPSWYSGTVEFDLQVQKADAPLPLVRMDRHMDTTLYLVDRGGKPALKLSTFERKAQPFGYQKSGFEPAMMPGKRDKRPLPPQERVAWAELPADGQWHRVLLAWEAGQYRLYVDGERKALLAAPAVLRWRDPSIFQPGLFLGGGEEGAGRAAIDSFMLYDWAFGDSQAEGRTAAIGLKPLPRPEVLTPSVYVFGKTPEETRRVIVNARRWHNGRRAMGYNASLYKVHDAGLQKLSGPMEGSMTYRGFCTLELEYEPLAPPAASTDVDMDSQELDLGELDVLAASEEPYLLKVNINCAGANPEPREITFTYGLQKETVRYFE
jgi:hypothetical protein